MTDVFKSFGKAIFGKTMKKAAKKGVEKAVTAAATKTGEHVGKKAGDKIVQMLSNWGVLLSQNLAMSLFLELTQPILIHKQQIHFYTILLIYQTMLMCLAVILRLEMEMSTLIFTLNQLQIQQEFSEK